MGRRAFLADLGRGAVAIAVFTPIIGACSSDSTVSGPAAGPASTPPAPGTALPSSVAAGASTTAATVTAPTPTDAAPVDAVATTAPLDDPITYRRVNLGFVSAYVLVRGKEAAVIDTGISGSAAAIGSALDAASLDWAAVRHVILTHHHPDHAGSIGDVLTEAINATAYAGEADVGSITAPRSLRSVVDGDEVFGLQIVGTPGHTEGHISIYDPLGQVLVAGDAINNVGELTGPNPQFSADMAVAAESAKRLADLPLETIFFGHGDPIEQGAGARLIELARSL